MTKSKELLIQDLGEKSRFCHVLYDEGKPLKQWGFLVCKMGGYPLRGPPTKDCGLKSYVEVPMGELGREELSPQPSFGMGPTSLAKKQQLLRTSPIKDPGHPGIEGYTSPGILYGQRRR